ncbi:hypothetical protein C8R44DRAFT_736316 [Mycena epipterygia]|nr:hypothetical protein C8R44DRAFT_736316 [Mycena epipterygia]
MSLRPFLVLLRRVYVLVRSQWDDKGIFSFSTRPLEEEEEEDCLRGPKLCHPIQSLKIKNPNELKEQLVSLRGLCPKILSNNDIFTTSLPERLDLKLRSGTIALNAIHQVSNIQLTVPTGPNQCESPGVQTNRTAQAAQAAQPLSPNKTQLAPARVFVTLCTISAITGGSTAGLLEYWMLHSSIVNPTTPVFQEPRNQGIDNSLQDFGTSPLNFWKGVADRRSPPFKGVSDILFRSQLQTLFRPQLGSNLGHHLSGFGPEKYNGRAKSKSGPKLGSK